MNLIHINSFKSVQIEMLAQDTKARLGYATGFICLYSNRYFLVTNWHVVSGRNFQHKVIINPSGATPGFFNLSLHIGQRQTETTFQPVHCTMNNIPLYECSIEPIDELRSEVIFINKPLWVEHPQHQSNVDIAVVDVTEEVIKDEKFRTIAYEISKGNQQHELGVMDDVFVVGYPLKTNTTPNLYPIYKGATIASEPNVHSALPLFYIDGKTKKGMSGSAVIKKHKPQLGFDEKSGTLSLSQDKTELIGVYSGRDSQSDSEHEAELGIVWKIQECLIPILDKAVELNIPETSLTGQLRNFVKSNTPVLE